MKYIKQIAALLLTSLFLCSMSVTAYANEIPDESRKGTITVEMAYDGKPITGGTLTLYRVGRVQEDDGNYRFVKTSGMEDFSGDYNNIGSAKLAEDVAAFVSEHGISAYAAAENTEGRPFLPIWNWGCISLFRRKLQTVISRCSHSLFRFR